MPNSGRDGDLRLAPAPQPPAVSSGLNSASLVQQSQFWDNPNAFQACPVLLCPGPSMLACLLCLHAGPRPCSVGTCVDPFCTIHRLDKNGSNLEVFASGVLRPAR